VRGTLENALSLTEVNAKKYEKDKKFLNFNIRNILTDLLQAEYHATRMQTLSYIQGEGACMLKHLLHVRGELKEAMQHTKDEKQFQHFNNAFMRLEEFLDEVETGRAKFTKKDLVDFIRSIRKEVEEVVPVYKTYYCKCLHSIPYLKVLVPFFLGCILSAVVYMMLGVV